MSGNVKNTYILVMKYSKKKKRRVHNLKFTYMQPFPLGKPSITQLNPHPELWEKHSCLTPCNIASKHSKKGQLFLQIPVLRKEALLPRLYKCVSTACRITQLLSLKSLNFAGSLKQMLSYTETLQEVHWHNNSCVFFSAQAWRHFHNI